MKSTLFDTWRSGWFVQITCFGGITVGLEKKCIGLHGEYFEKTIELSTSLDHSLYSSLTHCFYIDNHVTCADGGSVSAQSIHLEKGENNCWHTSKKKIIKIYFSLYIKILTRLYRKFWQQNWESVHRHPTFKIIFFTSFKILTLTLIAKMCQIYFKLFIPMMIF